MRRKSKSCVVAAALAWPLCLAHARAVEINPTPKELLIPYATRRIDGDLGEWPLGARAHVIDPSRAGQDPAIGVFQNDPDNPIRGPQDLSARVALSWDEEHLFIAGMVRDDDLRGIKPGRPHNVGPPGWGCDSVMFRIHSFRQSLRTNSPHSQTPMIALRYEVPPGGLGHLLDNSRGVLDKADAYWKLPQGSLAACRETPDGYQVEAAVPWKSLEYRPQAGEVLLGAFLLADIDGGQKLNQLGWHFSEDARSMAVFRLVRRPEATGLLSPSRSRVEAGGRWSVGYRVDARTADVRIRQLVLSGPQGEEKQPAILGVDLTVPQGQTATDVLVAEAVPDKPGKYRASLVGEIEGQLVDLAAEDLEILPKTAPAPAIQNPAGEIHHQRPGRVAHSAYEDHRRGVLRHGFVTDRSGYERYILTHARDYLDRNMPPALDRRSPHIADQVLMSYALFQITGEPKYADWTRRGIRLALDLQKEKLDLHQLFPLVPVRYHVWLHEPDTPLAPPDAEKDFQEVWARAATEHDPGWMFAEWGYHNRCYHRLYLQKIARHFARKLNRPVSPRIDEYIAWHDPLVERFGPANDNSSGYNWVGFRYPVYWAQATDTMSELAQHEGWLAGLNRWRRYSSPSGAVPNFGDTSGWGTGAPDAMSRYELMGRVSRDGRFRWQAHRIAEWLYNHFWPRHDQYHLPRDRTALNFCLAWLYADDSVQPVPPDSSSLITFRHRTVDVTEAEKLARPGLSHTKLVDEQVPDKLVLSSGNDPRYLWALVELIDLGGHCGRIPGHVACLVQHDAALLAGQGYYERSCEFNNILWIEDMDGLAVDPRPMRAEVPRYVDDPAVTYARVRVGRFEQMPVTYVRDIVFVKNAFMLVKDRVTFQATMRVRVGPCWQTRDLGPQCGDDWLNAYYDQLYYTGLGLGRGVHAYRNPAWDLLVRFAPRQDTQITVLDRYHDNPYRPSPTQLRQSWSGIAKAGDTKTFTTILLPHAPAFDVSPFADWAEFVLDDDNATLARVTTEFDNVNHLRETHWVLLQKKPARIDARGFQSDARLALISTDHQGRLKPAVIVEGTTLRLAGEDLAPGARKPRLTPAYEIPR